MTEKDWFDDIFDKPSGELNEEAHKKREILREVLTDRQADRLSNTNDPLPWNEQQLSEQKNALNDKLFNNKPVTLVDQPEPANTPITITPEPGKFAKLTRYFVPVAMAASVAMVALNLVPLGTSPDYDNTPFNELLASNDMPLYNQLSGLSVNRSPTASGNAAAPSINISVSSPNRLSFQLIEYLIEYNLSYKFSDSSGDHQLQMFLYAPHTAEINALIEKEGVPNKVEDGDTVLVIKPQ